MVLEEINFCLTVFFKEFLFIRLSTYLRNNKINGWILKQSLCKKLPGCTVQLKIKNLIKYTTQSSGLTGLNCKRLYALISIRMKRYYCNVCVLTLTTSL